MRKDMKKLKFGQRLDRFKAEFQDRLFTVADVAEEYAVTYSTAWTYILMLRHKIYIKRWLNPPSGPKIAVYCFGVGVDARKPIQEHVRRETEQALQNLEKRSWHDV